LQLKDIGSNTFAVFTSDGTTQANLDVGAIDVSQLNSGTSTIGIGGPNGNAFITVGGFANVLVVTDTGANITGTFNATGNANVANIGATSVVATNLTGTLQTAAQNNITSVGTLTSLSVTGNVSAGNLSGTTITGTTSVIGGGITLDANTISSSGSTLTIDPSAPGITGSVVIAGNLTVQGNVTAYDSTTVTINDLVFTVANNAATSSAANGGGIEVGPVGSSYATWLYDQPNNRWGTAIGISATGNIVGGNLSGTSIVGTLTTASQTNITGVGALNAGSITSGFGAIDIGTDTITVGGIVNANANGVGNIGSSSNTFNTVFAKATSAQYADLAEMYEADGPVEPGTVVCFGGAKEVTVCDIDASRKVAGVVSTNPSYLMNSGQTGDYVVAVALQGRVPVKVTGRVRKGDMMVAAGDGRARADENPQVGSVIGKALADFDGADGVIEVVIGRV
jgi:hypothetical protein